MTCRLLKNITHTCEYNPGGIVAVYLLDIRDFFSYRFDDDGLFHSGFVSVIDSKEPFREIGTVNESAFTETCDNGVYKQQLTTFIRTLSGEKLSDLLVTASNKHLVAFRNSQGKIYCFGSDGGASLAFSQISGQVGETAGYQVTITKESVYPLFETDPERFNTVPVLGTEFPQVVKTEDSENAILISNVGNGFDDDPIPAPNPQPLPEPQYDPDDYDTLDKNVRFVFHHMTVRGYGEHYESKSGLSECDYDIFNPMLDDRDGQPNGYYVSTNQPPYIGAVGAYKVVDIDEISVFAQPLRIHTGQNSHGSYCNGLDVRMSDVRALMPDAPIRSLTEWDNCIGGYYAWGHTQVHGVFFPYSFDIYKSRDDQTLIEGFDIITTAQLLQIIGEAPQPDDDYLKNIYDFIFVDKTNDVSDNPVTQYNKFSGAKNTSGFSLFPSGSVQNTDSHATRPMNVYMQDFGNRLALITKRDPSLSQVHITYLQKSPDIREIASNRAFAHGGQVRYARTKTASELKYKLVVEGDKILFVSPSDSRADLETGIVRGVALRYANRGKKVITKPYSEIVGEANEISSLFSINTNHQQ